MIVNNVLRGADPEVFLKSVETGSPVVSIGLIGGTKKKPRKIGNGYALQEDNVTAEFNIPPSNNKKAFVASLEYTLSFLRSELSPKGLDLSIVPSMEFTEEQLDHPQAQELGCEPDYNAWTGEMNPRPFAPPSLRSAGGHLHIGYDNPTIAISQEIIKAHDLFLGVASVLYDPDKRRRQIYGKAGACRFKGYGVEYRTPSNFWISSTELMEWAYEQSEKAINFVNEGIQLTEAMSNNIINCINKGNKGLVRVLDKQYGIL